MRRHGLSSLVLVLAFSPASCGGHGAADPTLGSSRITVDRGGMGARRLLEAGAWATYCATDSSLVVMGRGAEWFAAVGARVAWPPSSAVEMPVAANLEGLGTAAAALRPLADSVGRALVALRGTVTLDPGALASGRFDVVAEASDTSAVRLVGEFRNVEVRPVCESRG